MLAPIWCCESTFCSFSWLYIEVCQNTCFVLFFWNRCFESLLMKLFCPPENHGFLQQMLSFFFYLLCEGVSLMLAGNYWTKFDMGPTRASLRHFPMAKEHLNCSMLICIYKSMALFFTIPSVYSRRLRPYVWIISRKYIVSKNNLPTITFR